MSAGLGAERVAADVHQGDQGTNDHQDLAKPMQHLLTSILTDPIVDSRGGGNRGIPAPEPS